MASTTISANWTSVGFTPTGGSPQSITRVSNVDFNPGGQLTPYSGDANRFPVGLFPLMSTPGATVSSENIAALIALTPGTSGVLVATLNDVKNLATANGGALLFTLSNAVVENVPVGGRHAQFATGQVTFRAFSSDGTTSPLAVTPV